MARPKKIPGAISTKHFSNVTPLWVAPSRTAIPKIYHDAVMSLARWVGPQWSNNEETEFFMMRDLCIKMCERWTSDDWRADTDLFKIACKDTKQRPSFTNSVSNLLKTFKTTKLIMEKRIFIVSLMSELAVEMQPDVTNEKAIGAVEHALAFTAKHSKRATDRPVRFGPLEYSSIPIRLPMPSSAIALALADLITLWRRDGSQAGSLFSPHPPKLSVNLPWKAIAEFASANSVPGEAIDANAAQTLVRNLARKVAWVHSSSE